MKLTDLIDKLPKTSTITIRRLKSLNIHTFFDLLNYFPNRYEDFSIISQLSKLQEGEVLTVKGKLISIKNEYTKRGLKIQKAVITDGISSIELIWFNQPYIVRNLKQNDLISASGEVKRFGNKYSLEVKNHEVLKDQNQKTLHTGRLVPIYSEKKQLTSKLLREKVNIVIDNKASEILPKEILDFNDLLDESSAYKNIHFPESKLLVEKSIQRLSFDELFVIQLSTSLIKDEWNKETVGNPFAVRAHHDAPLQKFIKSLPFELTSAQKKCLDEIISDLKQTKPMNRFLQGDVGSGKTVVAAVSAYLSFLNGYKTLFMAPTEILAEQHFQTISKLFNNYAVKVGLQTGSKKIKKESDYDIVVGTHALLSDKLDFQKVGLIVIDEQHRFGVTQRAALKKKGINPHLLTMTATPIPRTVVLTLYGELDLSLIDMMPQGRLPIKTYLVPKSKRDDSYQWIKKEIKTHGTQVFIVCPLIEESEVETMKSIKAVTKEFEFLKKEVFKKLKLGLLHGKMNPKEKDQIMQDFKKKKINILLSTSVVEVGIDVPNATIMIIEGAERYGLAQLHQLRGRVGRSDRQSYCLLFTESTEEKVLDRLRFFSKNNSGMEIADYDLKSRGSGDIYGTKQHGFKKLNIASLSDYELIKRTKNAVNYFKNKYTLDQFPILKERIEKYRVDMISRD